MRPLDKKGGQARKLPRKDLKRKSDIVIPTFTPEDLVRLGKQYAGLESPIDISFSILTSAKLRPLEWINFEKNPKRMKISNSGTTAILSAKWHGPRPYLAKGPLTGYYVFSQLHFHWGSTIEEGSEHTMDGKSFPLEAHVMFFKNTYLTQEDAMKQTDGTVTVAYLFTGKDNEDFNPIISALKEIQKPLTSYHLELLPLERFLHIFTDDYFMYWGNVVDRSILWLICRKPLGISARQLSLFHSMTGINEKPITKNFRGTKEINHRIVYHINASKNRSDLLIGVHRSSSKMNQNKKTKSGRHLGAKSAVSIGDGKPKNDELSKDGSVEKVSQNPNDDSIQINISVHADGNSENNISQSGIDLADEVVSLHSSPSNTDAVKLEKRRKSQIKFQLASALLNLEKEEGNDYAFLEKYLQSKFESFQDEQCYLPTSDENQRQTILLPSFRSLQMNSYEESKMCMVSPVRDKSKSDTNCFKNFSTSGAEEDVEIGEGCKSGWSSMNSIAEEEGVDERKGERIAPSRPKTSAAKLDDSSSRLMMEAEGRVLALRSSSKLSHVAPPPPMTSPINRAVLIRKPSSDKERSKKGTLRESSCKAPESTVDEARAKIRSSLRQSMSKLSKLRGSPSKNHKPDSRSARPAWRY